MTPSEFVTKWQNGDVLEMKRKVFNRITYQYTNNKGRSKSLVIGLIDDQTLATSLTTAFPDNYLIETIEYLTAEDPTEATPRVPVFINKNLTSNVDATVQTVDGDVSTVLAKVTTQEAVDLITAFVPQL